MIVLDEIEEDLGEITLYVVVVNDVYQPHLLLANVEEVDRILVDAF